MYRLGGLTEENGKDISMSELPENLLTYDISNQMQMCVCITMYNEDFDQVLLSLAGIFRAYYELVEISKRYKDKVNIIIVWDGVEQLGKQNEIIYLETKFKMQMKKAGIFDVGRLRDTFKFKDEQKDERKENGEDEVHIEVNFLFNIY